MIFLRETHRIELGKGLVKRNVSFVRNKARSTNHSAKRHLYAVRKSKPFLQFLATEQADGEESDDDVKKRDDDLEEVAVYMTSNDYEDDGDISCTGINSHVSTASDPIYLDAFIARSCDAAF